MPAIELHGVSAHYPGARAEDEAVLTDVSLAVDAGELCVLLGPNGAGKSTLLRVAAGLLRASRGTVRLLGDPIEALDRREVARRAALVTQEHGDAAGFTVREVVAMGRAPHQGVWQRPTAADRHAVEQALADCELAGLADRALTSLSGGERQRVHVARALAQGAPALLLDEAAAHLDIRHKQALHRLIAAQVRERGLACLATLHDLTDALSLGDRAVLLAGGRIQAAGRTDEVMQADRLSAAFGTPLEVGSTGNGRRFVLPAPHRSDDRCD